MFHSTPWYRQRRGRFWLKDTTLHTSQTRLFPPRSTGPLEVLISFCYSLSLSLTHTHLFICSLTHSLDWHIPQTHFLTISFTWAIYYFHSFIFIKKRGSTEYAFYAVCREIELSSNERKWRKIGSRFLHSHQDIIKTSHLLWFSFPIFSIGPGTTCTSNRNFGDYHSMR